MTVPSPLARSLSGDSSFLLYTLSRITSPLPFPSIFRSHRSFSNHSVLLGSTSVSVYKSNISMILHRLLSPGNILLSRYGYRIFSMNHPVAPVTAKSWSSSANLKTHVALRKPNSNSHKESPPEMPFDICQSGKKLPASTTLLLERNEEEGSRMCDLKVLRPGMVLLKEYLTLEEQVSIVRECRKLGLGPGGFYKPAMRLMLMCLGLDWDPATRKYSKIRRLDKAQAPNIPYEFLAMANSAVIASRAHVKKESGVKNVEDILPMMSPDVCIVNFYTTEGRLGLHQDSDESKASLANGLPIISMSVGDSGEFFYGDRREIRYAQRVVLKSGDVLIFGGPSRHIFHGVQSILPSSAPESLLKETNLRPGRLNLTFRQY